MFILFQAAGFVHPLVLLQPFKGADNALFDGEGGVPAGGADFRRIEEDERVIAHPAAAAAGVFEGGFQGKGFADVAHGVVNLHVFVGAEIINFDAVPRLLRGAEADDMEHGADAVLHVEVGLALGAVAEHFQAVGMFQELAVKIEHVAVGVAFAEDGDEAEDVAFEFVTFAIGGDHAFAAEFGAGVERGLDGERRGFGRGDDFGLAVNGAGGAEGDALDVVGAHGFEDIEGGDGVLLEIFAGMFEAEPDVGIGAEVEHGVGAGHGAGEGGEIQIIALDEFEVGVLQCAVQKTYLAGRKVIPADDGFAVGEQTVDKAAADEAGGTGNKNLFHYVERNSSENGGHSPALLAVGGRFWGCGGVGGRLAEVFWSGILSGWQALNKFGVGMVLCMRDNVKHWIDSGFWWRLKLSRSQQSLTW